MKKQAWKGLAFAALCAAGVGLTTQSVGATTYAPGTGYCETVELPVQDENAKEYMNLKVFDKATNKALQNVKLKVVDVTTDKVVATVVSDKDGEASVRVKVGTYKVIVEKASKKYSNSKGKEFVSALVQGGTRTDIGLSQN